MTDRARRPDRRPTSGDELRDLVPDVPPIGEDEIPDLRRHRRYESDDTEHACTVAAARGKERIERVTTMLGIHRHSVGQRRARRSATPDRSGVRARGERVAPLRIGDHGRRPSRIRAGRPRERATPSDREPRRGEMRLDRDEVGATASTSRGRNAHMRQLAGPRPRCACIQ